MQPLAPTTPFVGWIIRWFACPHAVQQTSTLPRQQTLRERQLLSVSLKPMERIICRNGALWLTSNRSTDDILLRKGDSFSIPRYSEVMIEALEDSALELTGNTVCR